MPLWCPPTPPQQETDLYIDYTMGFLYEMSVMSESQLPPVYIKKESNKRSRHEAGLSVDAVGRRAVKVARKDDIYEPKSLFDRPSPEMMKMRREIKQQRYRGIIRPQLAKPGLKLPQLTKPQPDPPCWHNWTVHEDMQLLKAIQTFQGLPLNLMVISPGHTVNWDFAADYVNTTSITYRSPKQCRHRYETVLINREEGKLLYDNSSRKKKNKNIYTKFPQQMKSNRPMRTAQLYTQDNNSTFSQLMITRFDSLKNISAKRPVTTKSQASNNQVAKNQKHTAVLNEYGINYESPLLPTEVATKRTDRLREKQKLAESARAKASTSTSAVTSVNVNVGSPSTSTTVPSSPSTSNVNVVQTTVVSTPQTVAVTVATTVQAPGTPPTAVRAQRIVASSLAGQTITVSGAATVGGVTTIAGKTITQAQLQLYRQQAALKQQMKLQALQGAAAKQTVTVQPGQVVVATQAGQQRAQFVRQAAVTVATGANKGITRTVSESEMAALIKRQQQLQQQKAALQAAASQQGATVTQLTQQQQAQLLAQAGIQLNLQVQPSASGQPTQVATLVKAVSGTPTSTVTIPVTLAAGKQATPTVATATIKPQQLRQLQIQQQLLAHKKLGGQKMLTSVGGKGVATQLIVQAQKTMPTTMTVQQFQQVMRHQGPQLAVSQGGQVVLAKAGPAGRVIPVNTGAGGLKPTIQVVTATSQGLAQGIRPQGTSTLAGALAGTIKVAPSGSNTQILSQVAALQQAGQQVAVRQSGSPVRIQTTSGAPLVAVTVQSGQVSQQQGAQQSQTGTDGNQQNTKQ